MTILTHINNMTLFSFFENKTGEEIYGGTEQGQTINKPQQRKNF
jgi:hypothetical protein